jgi:preprotein translocase subunit SecB
MTENETKHPEMQIQKIYVKDISFEAPNIPQIFQEDWKPNITLEMHIETNKGGEDIYEVCLKITVTNKLNDVTAFLVEVTQAGLFIIKNMPEDNLKPFLGIVCPNILLPYAREAISDLTGRAGFPPFYLSPINFEALYYQNAEKQQQ